MLSSRLMKKISRKSRTLLHGWFTFSTMMIQKKCLRFVYIYYTLLYIRGAINWILSAIPNSYTQLQIIFRVRKHILTGGPKRLPLTIPPLVFSALKVCLSLCDQLFTLFSNWGKNIKFCLHLEGVVCPSFFFQEALNLNFYVCTWVLLSWYDILAQLIRRMRGGDENPFGDDTSTPQKILQLLTEVSVCTYILIVRKEWGRFNCLASFGGVVPVKPSCFFLWKNDMSKLKFFSDRGSSIWCLGIWVGITTLLAMCSGIWSFSLWSPRIKTFRYSDELKVFWIPRQQMTVN